MEQYIKRLINKENLSINEAALAMECMMRGEATEAQIGSFITAMCMKGETVEELTGCATVMRRMCHTLQVEGDVLDIVGTGGDGGHTFNISTLASLVVAACGVKVAKHGNRGVTSKCGSADVMEGLGIHLNLTPEQNKEVFDEVGICFMFAPVYHQSLRYAAKPRKELGVKSIFNLLGPLANPAHVSHILLGVYDAKWAEPLAHVLIKLGIQKAMVVHGMDGIDEVSLTGPTQIYEVDHGTVKFYEIEPHQMGLACCNLEELNGGDLESHLEIAKSILSGEQQGPKRDAVILNAACGLYVAGKAKDLPSGVRLAKEAIESGAVQDVFLKLQETTQRKGSTYVS